MNIIAFGHQSRVGKDTACRAILRRVGKAYTVVGTSFATPLKAICYTLFRSYGLRPGPYYETGEGRRMRDVPLAGVGKTPVDIWIAVGRYLRAIHPNVWVDALLLSLDRLAPQPDLVVISDLRFPNEAAAIRARGGWCVRVTRPDAPPPKASDNEFPPDFPWDAVVMNTGTVEDLEQTAIALAERKLGVSLDGSVEDMLT